jgi:hypothetical protein
VARESDSRRKLDRAPEGAEVVPQRLGARLRIQPNRGSDLSQEVVARHEHPVAMEADVPVRVAGQLEHAPAVDLVAFPQRPGCTGEADERPQPPRLVPQLRCERLGKVERQPPDPAREPRHPSVAGGELAPLLAPECPQDLDERPIGPPQRHPPDVGRAEEREDVDA